MSDEIRWVEPKPINVPEEFRLAIGGHPLVAETLWRRGHRTLEAAQAFLDPDAYQPTSADELPDAKIAYELITKAINNREKILIWGDFDVDGQTSTTVLVEGLRGLGANVDYHIPIRADESHGITERVLQRYLDEGFDLFITCDTGITENENIQRITESGIPVVLTDHHTLGETLPAAAAVVNPQRLPEDHPLRTLPGVGVTCKLMEGLYAYLDEPFKGGPFYELAALGIVADVAILRGDTRWLLQMGLRQLQHTKRLGLQTLIKNANLNPQKITETHIGFQIAPRLNAVGRLSDANPIVTFLTTDDPGEARVIGTTIEALNAQRRMITRQVSQAAEKLLESSPDDRRAAAIVLHHPDWPGGVVGIVANRLVENYHKPAILLTGEDPFHGSARSVDGINITEAIGTQSHLLLGYGGHPMAAGMSLQSGNFNAFKRGLSDAVADQAKRLKKVPEIEIHQTIRLDEINFDLLTEMNRLAPFGPGNPPLNFLLQDLQFVSASEVGQTGEHRRVIASDGAEHEQSFIWWHGADKALPPEEFDLICQLSESDYKGSAQISAEWIADRPAKAGTAATPKRQLEIMDYRMRPASDKLLQSLIAEDPTLQIWAEHIQPEGVPSQIRLELNPANTLVIWTCPPTRAVLSQALRQVHPNKVIVFGHDPQMETWQQLTKFIAGLAKFVIAHRDRVTSLTAMAAACAMDTEVVRAALHYWVSQGAFGITIEDDKVSFSEPTQEVNATSKEIYQGILITLMKETKAYRQFFKSSTVEILFTS